MPRQNLSDILGKAGDFQFSFAVKDMLSPAIESIDKASHAMMGFFDKSVKKVSKAFGRGGRGH